MSYQNSPLDATGLRLHILKQLHKMFQLFNSELNNALQKFVE